MKMKVQFYILALIFFINLNSKSYEIPNSFDLTIKETFGCTEINRTYINFHFENDLFTITRATDNSRLQFEKFSAEKFESFYLKIQRFNLNQLNSGYYCNKWGTAMGFGSLEITLDNKKQLIKYTTQPCDGTDFEHLHKWLSDYSLEISKKLTFQDLIDSKFYLIDYISDEAVQKAVDENSTRLNIDDFFSTIDTTKNSSFRSTLINCLQYFKDERVLDLFGPLLMKNLDNIEDKYTNWWMTDNSIYLKSIMSQNKSDKKREYLTSFLKSNNKNVRLNSAIALAVDGDCTGIDLIFESINDFSGSSRYCTKWSEFSALTYLNKTIVLPRLLSNFKAIDTNNKIILENYPSIIKGYIVAINNILGDNKSLSPEDLRLICEDMDLNTELKKVEKKIKGDY